jgi:XisI protein
MDTRERLTECVETLLTEYTRIPYSHGAFQTEAIFDRARDRFVLMNVGWDGCERVHGCLVHVDLVDGKLWIQRDGTEHGVARELVEAGVPRDRIVLAFKPPTIRSLTEYAVA